MNKFGKGNFIFIILIPLFLIGTLIIFDTIISYSQNKNFKSVTEKIITQVMNDEKFDYDEYYEEIKRLYEYYNYDTNMLVVSANEYKVTVDNEHKYFGLLSSVTNRNSEDTIINIFGIEFNAKKGSKISISVEASYNYEDELVFKYVE